MSISWKMFEHKIKEKKSNNSLKKSPEKGKVNLFIYAILAFFTIIFIGLALTCILSGCTLNMIMTHTEGRASDVVDSDPTNKPQIEATVKLPMVP